MPQEDVTTVFTADITDFKSAMQEASRKIRLANAEFNALASTMDSTTSEQDRLTAKIVRANKIREAEQRKLEALQQEYNRVVAEQGENSRGAEELKVKLDQQQAAVNNVVKALQELNNALNNVNTTQKEAAEETTNFSDALKGIGRGLARGVVAVGAAAAGAVTSFFALAESTREYRTELAKLKASANDTGTSFDNIKKQYQETVAILGDEGAAIEGYNNLMTLANGNEDFINTVSKSFEGASIKWKDTLKFEGLSDSLQETLATGKGVGQFSELLERNGVNIDRFNAGLASCSTELEKQNYIADELAKLGLAEISDAYKEQNKDLYEASMAQQNLTDKMANLGAIAEPIITIFKVNFASALEYITPFVERLATAFTKLVSGDIQGGLTDFSEVLTSVRETIAELGISALNTITELIPQILPKVMELLTNIVNGLIEFTPVLLESALQLLGAILEALPPTIIKLVEALPMLLQTLGDKLTEFIPKLFEYATTFLNTIVDALPGVIQSLVEALPQIIETVVNFLITNMPVVFEKAIELFMKLVEAIPKVIVELIGALPKIINTIINFLVSKLPDILKLGRELFLQLVKAIPGMIVDLLKGLGDIREAIFDTLGEIDLLEIGKNIIEGLIEGMYDMLSSVGDAVKEIGGEIKDAFVEFFGIASPSKLMKNQVGKYIGEGITAGIPEGFNKDIKKVEQGMLNSLSSFRPKPANIDINDVNSQARVGTNKNVSVNYTVYSPNPMNRKELWNQSKRLNKLLQGV